MNFLFPLFLIAGLAVAIPIIIHLFNFRKYKTIEFSDTRLLQHIKITSKKSRKVQHWWLLLSRILFVGALVLAFAQPYLGIKKDDTKNLQIIYIDNSQSMADNLGAQRQLFQNAVDEAKALVEMQDEHQQYILLNNNNVYASRPIGKAEALEQLSSLRISGRIASLQQINQAVNNALADNNANSADVHIFSDLQKSTLFRHEIAEPDANVNFIFRPVLHKETANLYIDTAYFTEPVIDTRKENPLVVRVGRSNAKGPMQSQVQVWVNEQVRAAKNIEFTNDGLWTDSIPLMINTPGWHRIAITVKDAPIQFDDTFRITAKTNATLSVMNLSDGSNSPYLQAAFSPLNGFMTRQAPLNISSAKDWADNNLIVLQNIQQLSDPMADAIKVGLQNGQSFFLIPGDINDLQAFNRSLGRIAPISFGRPDTTRTQVGSLQTEHALLRDVIAALPANAQLPTVLQHYPISAGLSAAQQSILTLKNGKPYLAQYSIGNGALFIVAAGLDERSGNFVLSNLFMPVIYKMCAISGSQSIYAVNANSDRPVFIPGKGSNRTVFKAVGPGTEAIPPQEPYGNGTHIFPGKVLNEPGFYVLSNGSMADSTLVAVNSDLLESKLEAATQKELEAELAPAKVIWKKDTAVQSGSSGDSNALWKWLAGIAILALIIETYFLLRNPKPVDK